MPLEPAEGRAWPGHVQLKACEEYGAVEVPLRDLLDANGALQLDPEVENGDYFSVSLSRGRITLSARHYVGYVPLNERVVVHVRPRVPVANLTAIAELAGLPHFMFSSLRDYSLTSTWSDSFLDLYGAALAGHVEHIADAGLLREYQRTEEVTSFPSGRVLLSRTVQRHLASGQTHRADAVRFVRTADNGPNRCLKYAVWLAAQRYGRRGQWTREARIVHRRLNTAYAVLDGVHLDPAQEFLHDPMVAGRRDVPSLRAYYRDALDVAQAVIRHQGLLLDGDDATGVRLPSLVLNMAALFEAYVRRALQIFAADNQWPWQVLDGNGAGSRPLYTGMPSPKATPDIVVADDDIEPLVLDVKYKPVPDIPSRDDVNQAVTYAACYETSRVVLIHPCGAGQQPGIRKTGDVGPVAVYIYRFDLGSADLNEETARLAAAVASLLAGRPAVSAVS